MLPVSTRQARLFEKLLGEVEGHDVIAETERDVRERRQQRAPVKTRDETTT